MPITSKKDTLTLQFISTTDTMYNEAITIRKNVFFKGMNDQMQLINDTYEQTGKHVVCLDNNKKVIGTGRLNIENNTGVISQMAVATDHQKKGIGTKLLQTLIDECTSLTINTIELSAREKAIDFYKKFDFESIGEKYPSTKTGIIHQNMRKNCPKRTSK